MHVGFYGLLVAYSRRIARGDDACGQLDRIDRLPRLLRLALGWFGGARAGGQSAPCEQQHHQSPIHHSRSSRRPLRHRPILRTYFS